MITTSLFRKYLIQLQQLGLEHLLLSSDFKPESLLKKNVPETSPPIGSVGTLPSVKPGAKKSIKKDGLDSIDRLSRLKPVKELGHEFSSGSVSSSKQTPKASKRDQLIDLYKSSKDCNACELCANRKKLVFGSGNIQSALLIIGDYPEGEDEKTMIPFSGEIAALFEKMLEAIEIDRNKDSFVTTALKCRPAQNSVPEHRKADSCLPLLEKQIDIMKPKVILAMGEVAVKAVLDTEDGLDSVRNRQNSYNSIPVIVTYSPRFLLKAEKSFKLSAWQDLIKTQKILNSYGIYGSNKK
ncbi:Uracil-DNA glycosylase, family 4 [Chitinispirillum alkaliphilum]|nr:Uracil-DNA glycosylase, family 4 [Chitinispirillum alkaliphilum]